MQSIQKVNSRPKILEVGIFALGPFRLQLFQVRIWLNDSQLGTNCNICTFKTYG